MFNLEQAISEWRRQMLSAGIKSPVPLDELESHLREDIEREVQTGLNAQQAFEAAVQRIGQARALQAEFAKTAELKEMRERKLKLLCIVFTASAYLAPFALSGPKPWSRMNPTEQWLGLAAIGLSVVSMFSGLFLHRFLPVIPDKRVRTRVQFAGALPLFVWLCVFGFIVLPRVELTVAQLMVATLWAISPLALFGGLICGLDEAAYRRTSTDRP
jgi:hypothetical protein